jgi:putative transposase
MMESFLLHPARELLDTRRWNNRAELGSAILECIECWYNPRRRHTSLKIFPVDFEEQRAAFPTLAEPAA